MREILDSRLEYIPICEFKRRMALRAGMCAADQIEIDFYMHMALHLGQNSKVLEYLEKGADPNSKDFEKRTGLFITNKIGCVLTVLEARGSPFIRNAEGIFPAEHHLAWNNRTISLVLAQEMKRHERTSQMTFMAGLRPAAEEASKRAQRLGLGNPWPHVRHVFTNHAPS